VTARTQTWELLVLRLVVHPVIWGAISALFSYTLQHIGVLRASSAFCLVADEHLVLQEGCSFLIWPMCVAGNMYPGSVLA